MTEVNLSEDEIKFLTTELEKMERHLTQLAGSIGLLAVFFKNILIFKKKPLTIVEFVNKSTKPREKP